MLLLSLSLLGVAGPAHAAPAYLRFPDLYGDTLVFNTGGDLWTASLSTGKAQRLTSSPGDERYPYFSPDGRQIAFTAAYDGNMDVYVVAATGGEPRRLTWTPGADEVVGWTPEGRVLYRTRAIEPHGEYTLETVSPDGGEPQAVPLGWAARLAVDPKTGMWAFNRIAHERATWKRYRGGMNSNIWVGDPNKQDYQQVTEFSGMDDFPMWWEGRIYFLSDRGGTYDLWSSKPDGSDARRQTNGGDWDARYPNQADDGRVVFTRAGEIWLYDPGSNQERKLALDIPAERALTRSRYLNTADYLTWYDLSPEGDRLALVTRGELFSVPTEDGVTLPVTRGSGARESWASFSPDGRRVSYVTDASGEEAIVVADAWGRGEEQTVMPAGTSGWHFPPVWAPDGKHLAWSDQTNTLYVGAVPPAPVKGGKGKGKAPPAPEVKKVDQSEQWEITEYAWSPDGRWLAYSKTDRRDYNSIWIYDTTTGTKTRLGGGNTDDHSPAWDPDGRYLYFLSDRTVNPMLGFRDFQAVFGPPTKVCLALLRPDVDNPMTPKVGAPEQAPPVEKEKARRKRRREKAEGAEEGPKPVDIELAHLDERVVVLPIATGVYGSLAATSDRVFYLSRPLLGMVEGEEREGPGADLMSFELESKEASTFLSGVGSFSLALKGEKMAVTRGPGSIAVVGTDSPPSPDDLEDIDLGDVVVDLDSAAEWRQIYYEGWRLMRDFYWDPGMAGVDWVAVRDRYATVLPRISTRDELKDLMGEVIGELATSHTYLWGGDDRLAQPGVSVGMLGADVVREGNAFKVTHLYHGDPADNLENPLMNPGSEVREGEYVLAVNNRPLDPVRPFLSNFESMADEAVVLTVNGKPTTEGARDVVVTLTGDESALRYADWVRQNREYVASKTDGKIGYLHVPDMDTAGLVAFFTWYFPQLDKEGLIVDVRWNGGGFVSQLILERLRRQVTGMDRARGGGQWTYPASALNGPFVVLTNEFAGSDGDIFPRKIQQEKLAPVIGERSWGGVIGIRADKPLVDRGMITQPEFASWFVGKGWEVENHGVDPDIVVQNRPQDLAAGKDPQLDAAIAEVLKLRASKPPVKPEYAPAPSRARDAFKGELQDQGGAGGK